MRITTRQHPVVQACRRLARGPAGGRVLLDGPHLVAEALAASVAVDALIHAGDRHAELAARAAGRGARVHHAAPAVLDAASPARSPSGLVAIARWTPGGLDAVFAPAPALVLGLVDVQDPGNVGAAIRSADALGATGVVAIGASADPAGWKALRGAMGSTFRLPVARASLDAALDAARRHGAAVLATRPGSGEPPEALPLDGPVLLLLGNEGAGLAGDAAAAASGALTLPMRAGVDSLNVAVTAALALDAARRRRARSRS